MREGRKKGDTREMGKIYIEVRKKITKKQGEKKGINRWKQNEILEREEKHMKKGGNFNWKQKNHM